MSPGATVAYPISEDDGKDVYDRGLNGVNQPANIAFVQTLWASLGLLTATIISIEITLSWVRQCRTIIWTAGPTESSQDGWLRPAFHWIPTAKQHFFYAPLFALRRARRLNVFGTLPTRTQTAFLLFYAASNIAYMFAVNFGNRNIYALLAEIRGRTGTLAVANRAPLVMLIGRNNPVTAWMRLKYDDCIMLHRWIGRIIIFEALLHGTAWAVVHTANTGWGSLWKEIRYDRFITSGFAAWACLALILVLSLNPVRSTWYEAFANIHLSLALVVFGAAVAHCKLSGFDLPHIPWVIAVPALWAVEGILRARRLMAFSFTSGKGANAEVEVVGSDANVCRITIHLPRRVNIRPGTHAYLRLKAVRPWETHPFSIAWVEHRLSPVEGLPKNRLEKQRVSTSVSFLVCAQQGFTRSLLSQTSACGGRVMTKATFEGPYDGLTSLDSYGHVVLVAGATGITHHLRYVRQLVLGYKSRTTAARRILLIWVVRKADAVQWIWPWLCELLSLPDCAKLLAVRVHVTREQFQPASSALDIAMVYSPKRPDFNATIQDEVDNQLGAMFVMICGPGGLSDDVRAAVRQCQSSGHAIDFEENGFSW
ncbi:ferric reductase [Colletotrichum plurivorum]|uniref:Ferric reductase n=1 Tax=Colletotrichum plurivorum TaxID=2175906 RepID=A0A8H6K5V7_9PEZI|nr:ferric reductase [Colletotrichum plurivorum]